MNAVREAAELSQPSGGALRSRRRLSRIADPRPVITHKITHGGGSQTIKRFVPAVDEVSRTDQGRAVLIHLRLHLTRPL